MRLEAPEGGALAIEMKASNECSNWRTRRVPRRCATYLVLRS
jgi:hypothetical protein